MTELEPTVFAHTRCALGESPVWDERRHGLYWLDILGKALFFKTETQPRATRWSLPCMCSAVFLVTSDFNGVLLASEHGLASFELSTMSFRVLAVSGDERSAMRSNDGGVDPEGRVWYGTMAKQGGSEPGALYCWAGGERVHKVVEEVYIPNTFVWSAAGDVMISADSLHRKIFKYKFDAAEGRPAQRCTLIDLGATAFEPDGSAIDEDDTFWNAQWNGSRVVQYTLEGTGKRAVAMPVPRPTSCCFGGPDFSTLFVTSASTGLDAADLAAYPGSGAVFSVRTGRRGLPVKRSAWIAENGGLM